LSLALLSGGGLSLEIILTRLFSTVFYPPYVFVVLSLAVLGIGLGAAAATWRAPWRRPRRASAYMALAALCTLTLIVFAVRIASPALQIPLLVLVVSPYVFIGLALATIFSSSAAASPRLYLADLLGAGVGAVFAIPILNLVGVINGALLVALVLGAAGLAAGRRSISRLPATVIAVALVALGSNLTAGWLAVDMASLPSEKPIEESLTAGDELIQTAWNSFARTDLVASADGGPHQLYMDGAAGSIMPPAEDNDFLLRDIGLFPFATDQPERVFVIGPGGGLDVWFGLRSGADEIVAVEVNPASVSMVEDFADYNGDLYGQPAVRVIVDEGRSVLRREGTRYDLISLSQVTTLAAERTGYALTENTVYTLEAFQDYLAHLSTDGQIAIKLYDEMTLTRALSTALAAFRRQGLSDAEALRHVIVFLDPRPQPPIPLMVVRKTPYSREDALALGAVARDVGFAPLFLPEVWAEPPLDDVQSGKIPFTAVVEDSETDISPTTDDSPFFYQFERGIPRRLRPLLWSLVAIVLVGSGLLVVAQQSVTQVWLRWSPVYFASLGVGFIAIETAIIQQTRLFLGHPTLAVTTVLATLLVGGGLGSGLAGRWSRPDGGSIPVWPALGVTLLVLLWIPAWPWLNQRFLSADSRLRVLVVVTSLSPLALFMGMPFPLGLRAVGRASDRHVALGWAVNGVMSVVGSACAVTLAVIAGFSRVLLLGTLSYVVAGTVAFFINPGMTTKG
jgi:hypothetical protein